MRSIFNFSNKVSLISGSTKGIGRAIGEMLHQSGSKVAFSGRKLEPSLKTATSFCYEGDLTSVSSCENFVGEAIHRFGHIDHLVCAVGSGRSQNSDNSGEDEWIESIKVNFLSAVNLITAASPFLKKTNGSIVCISSICAADSKIGPAPYSSSKAALEMAIRKFARSFSNFGVRINGVAPGNILSPGNIWDQKLNSNPIEVNEMLSKNVPLKRFGSPEEIANATLFLLSDFSLFTTGTILVVDGGQSC